MTTAADWVTRSTPWTQLLATIDDVAAAGAGALVLIHGSAGTGRTSLLGAVESRLAAAGLEVRRAELIGAERSRSGRVAELLDLAARPAAGPTGLVVHEAQWADATSLGHLRSLLGGPHGVVVVLGYATPDEAVAIGLDRLARGVSVPVHHLELNPLIPPDLRPIVADPDLGEGLVAATGGDPGELIRLLDLWRDAGVLNLDGEAIALTGAMPADRPVPLHQAVAELPGPERLLVEAAALGGTPIPLAVAARLLGADEDAVLATGERLTRHKLVRDTPAGFAPPEAERAERIVAGMGEARRASVFGRLADAFLAGTQGRRPEVGGYLLEAGRPDEALPHLAEAALSHVAAGALPEALPLLDRALAAYQAVGDDPALEGRLRLGRAQVYRFLGWPDRAEEDIDIATRRLEGAELVDAYGWAAALADDRQRVQEAERLLAAGEYVAATIGEQGKLGSLLTLRARVLGRLGFGDEAEAAVDRGNAILAEHGTPVQRTRALYNRAWIDYDSGRMGAAAARFEELAGRFRADGDDTQLADALGWQARAQMYAGRPDAGLAAAAEAIEIGDRGGEVGPVFLAEMGRAAGAALHGAGDDALRAADEVLTIVLQQLPAWENVARFFRAQALFVLGRLDEAEEEADRAILASPEGVDGERWRLRCRALALRIAAARGTPWPMEVADELTETLLNGRWNLPAAVLMAERAAREKDPDLARQAAALAMQLGIPMVAARAAHAGDLWQEGTGTAVGAEIRRMSSHIPETWREGWAALPEVAGALAAPELPPEETDAATAELRRNLEEAFRSVGLAGADHVLSPAQRRAAGLRVGRPPRRRSRLRTLAGWTGGASVAAIAVVALVVALNPPEQTTTTTIPTTTTTIPTTTTTLPLEARVCPAPDTGVSAQWSQDRAGIARAGAVEASGVAVPCGQYWTKDFSDALDTAPVVRGNQLFIGSTSGTLYKLDTITSNPPLTPIDLPGIGPIRMPAVVDLVSGSSVTQGEGGTLLAFAVDERGATLAVQAGGGASGTPVPNWSASIGVEPTTSPLLLGSRIYIAGIDGYISAFDATGSGGDAVAVFPGPDSDIEPALSSGFLASDGDVIYALRQDGTLYALDPETLEPAVDPATGAARCVVENLEPPVGGPVLAGGYLYAATSTGVVYQIDPADCGGGIPIPYFSDRSGAASAPAAADGERVYQPFGQFLYVIPAGLERAESLTCSFTSRTRIVAPPSVAMTETGPVVYVANTDGTLYAIDGTDCTELWSFETRGEVIASPVVGNDVVFVTTRGGVLWAIAAAAGE